MLLQVEQPETPAPHPDLVASPGAEPEPQTGDSHNDEAQTAGDTDPATEQCARADDQHKDDNDTDEQKAGRFKQSKPGCGAVTHDGDSGSAAQVHRQADDGCAKEKVESANGARKRRQKHSYHAGTNQSGDKQATPCHCAGRQSHTGDDDDACAKNAEDDDDEDEDGAENGFTVHDFSSLFRPAQ